MKKYEQKKIRTWNYKDSGRNYVELITSFLTKT